MIFVALFFEPINDMRLSLRLLFRFQRVFRPYNFWFNHAFLVTVGTLIFFYHWIPWWCPQTLDFLFKLHFLELWDLRLKILSNCFLIIFLLLSELLPFFLLFELNFAVCLFLLAHYIAERIVIFGEIIRDRGLPTDSVFPPFLYLFINYFSNAFWMLQKFSTLDRDTTLLADLV